METCAMSNGIITCRELGGFGRWGNQIFQYCGAKAYAESIGAELFIPNWIGREIFENIREPILLTNFNLPDLSDSELDGRTNVNLRGYFQASKNIGMLSRKKIKEWLKPKEKYIKNGHDIVVHKRRTDYIGNGYYAVVTDTSYEDALAKYGYDASQAKVYSCENPESQQYDDFFEIMHSKVIFRSNSTFSWWAAALSDAKVYSPVVENRTGWVDVDFVEGNHPKIMQLFEDLNLME